MPASRAYSDCTAALTARGSSGSSWFSGMSSQRPTWQCPRSRAGPARLVKVQSMSLGPSAVMITIAGVKVAMAQPVPRREALEQGKDARGEVLGKQVAGRLHQGAYQVGQGDHARRWGRFVNAYGEGREDRARLLRRHGAGPHELQ